MTNHEDMEEQLIETIDEDGNVINFELIDIVQVEDDDSIKDNEYALLLPVDENGDSDEEKEVVLMKLIKDGEEYLFEAIEDDEEFDKVVEYINQLQSNDNDEE